VLAKNGMQPRPVGDVTQYGLGPKALWHCVSDGIQVVLVPLIQDQPVRVKARDLARELGADGAPPR
jgi:hypothetical protein